MSIEGELQADKEEDRRLPSTLKGSAAPLLDRRDIGAMLSLGTAALGVSERKGEQQATALANLQVSAAAVAGRAARSAGSLRKSCQLGFAAVSKSFR